MSFHNLLHQSQQKRKGLIQYAAMCARYSHEHICSIDDCMRPAVLYWHARHVDSLKIDYLIIATMLDGYLTVYCEMLRNAVYEEDKHKINHCQMGIMNVFIQFEKWYEEIVHEFKYASVYEGQFKLYTQYAFEMEPTVETVEQCISSILSALSIAVHCVMYEVKQLVKTQKRRPMQPI